MNPGGGVLASRSGPPSPASRPASFARASGEVGVEVESWTAAAAVAAGLAVAFRIGVWFCDRRAAAVLAVVRSFCAEVAVYHRLAADGAITDEEARELAGVVGQFVADLDALGELVCREETER